MKLVVGMKGNGVVGVLLAGDREPFEDVGMTERFVPRYGEGVEAVVNFVCG